MRASHLSRSLAGCIDLVVGFVAGVLLAPGPLGYFFSARAVVLLRIGEPDSWFVGPAAMVIGILGELIFLLPMALLLAVVPEVVFGRSFGKLVLSLRIETGRGDARTARLTVRYLLKTLPLSLTVMALVTGLWAVQVGAFLSAALMVGQWLFAAAVGSSVAHDRLTGTKVVRLPRR